MKKDKKLSSQEIKTYLNRCAGLPVSVIWKGYGSAIFLELGKLYQNKGKSKNLIPNGEIAIGINWSWRLELHKRIIVGSFESEKMIERIIKQITGINIKSISLFSRLPELNIEFDKEYWLNSFATTQGQPYWTIRYYNEACLYVKRGNIYLKVER